MRRLLWSDLDPIAELREAFASYPNLTLESSAFRDERGHFTRIWWRDAASGKRGALVEVKDAEIVPAMTEIIGQLMRLRRGRAKGASA